MNSLKEFNDSVAGNFGLAVSHLGIFRNSKHLQEINSWLKIPLALFIPDNYEFNKEIPAFIQKKMISIETAGLRYFEFDENYIPCYKVHSMDKKGGDMISLLSDISPYFFFKGLYPSRDAILDICRQDKEIMPLLFKITVKLGIKNIMLIWEKTNLDSVLEYYSEKTIAINTKAIIDPQIFEVWRNQIDALDNQLIETLAKRLQIVCEMGAYKSEHEMPLFEAGRWQEILQSRKEIAKTKGIDEDFIEKIFEAIHLSGLKKMLEE